MKSLKTLRMLALIVTVSGLMTGCETLTEIQESRVPEFLNRAGDLHENHQSWTEPQREFIGDVLHHVNYLENK